MHPSTSRPAPRLTVMLVWFAVAAIVNGVGWWWANRPIPTGYTAGGSALGQIQSVSFAPFRRGQGPLDRIYPSEAEVVADLASLQGLAGGVRTYTAREGLEVVPRHADRFGLAVMQGLWLGREAAINKAEVQAAIDLANRYPDTIKSIVVGNEVLLRKDLTVDQLIGYIREVKAAVRQPVTYADVWEFWLRFPQLLAEVDFVTVHFLPYWEDRPISVAHAMPHIMAVYNTVRAQLPGKPVVIGEVGWPSEGRSRRQAVPSAPEASAFIADFMRLAAAEGLSYNLVEAFDQPWKVKLEGTVGGTWGLLDEFRAAKFAVGGLVSKLPQWPVFAAFASVLSAIFLIAVARRLSGQSAAVVALVAAATQVCGTLLAATVEHGLAHNHSLGRVLEGTAMAALQALFAMLVIREFADRLAGNYRQAGTVSLVGSWTGVMRQLAGQVRLGIGMTAIPASLRRQRLTMALYGLFALYVAYQGVMLVAVGRYRDFQIDYALLPLVGILGIRLLAGLRSGRMPGMPDFALAGRADPLSGQRRFGCEAVLAFLLLCLPVLVLMVEKPDNLEALYWCAIMGGYAVPLLAGLVAAARQADKGFAEPGPSR